MYWVMGEVMENREAVERVVQEHGRWVFCAARRQVRDVALAEDVAQGVFLMYWRKGPGTEGAEGVEGQGNLAGWLYRAVRYCSANALRLQRIRQRHEREAAMEKKRSEGTAGWMEVEGELEGAVDGLSEKDRQAVVLRFYRGLSLSEVGKAMGINERAAQKRVDRAVGKLREMLAGKGVEVEAGSLGAMVLAHAVEGGVEGGAAGLLEKVMAGIGGGGGNGTAGMIAKGAEKMMVWAKVKVAAGILGVSVIVGVGAAVAGSSKVPGATTAPGAAVAAQVEPTTAPVRRAAPSDTISVELGKTTLQVDGIAADGMGTTVGFSRAQPLDVATEAEARRWVQEWSDAISAKQYRFVREFDGPRGERQYEYAIRLGNGQEDKLSGTVRLEAVSSWEEWQQRQQMVLREQFEQFLEALRAGRAHIVADDVIIVHVCMDDELEKKIEVFRLLRPDGTLFAGIHDSPLGSSQWSRKTSWGEHLDALSKGKRKLLEVNATAVFTYEYPGADGKMTRYSLTGSPMVEGTK